MSERIFLLFLSSLLSLTMPFLPTFAQGADSAPTSPAQAAAASGVPLATAPPSAAPSARATAFARAQKLYRNGKLGDAESEYKALLQGDPRSGLAYVGLVRVYLKQK